MKKILITIIFILFAPLNVFADWSTADCYYVVEAILSTHTTNNALNMSIPVLNGNGKIVSGLEEESVTSYKHGNLKVWYSDDLGWHLNSEKTIYYDSLGFDTVSSRPDSCSDQPDDCTDKEGDSTGLVEADGMYPNPFCYNECEAEISQEGSPMQMYKPDTNTTYQMGIYTGNSCNETNPPPQASPPPDCNDYTSRCNEFCRNDTLENICNESVQKCTCNSPPPFPLVDDLENGGVQPDQDADGVGSNSDNDVDGDGDNNGNDDDVDGDGVDNRNDPNVDGDDVNNNGQIGTGWNDHSSHGTGNGLGADPDVDGDGIQNGNDLDVDGDGIPNSIDPDIDGDGILNDLDLDADGDGIPDGEDSDADGDGLQNSEDPDPTGNNAVIGDVDGDGEQEGTEEGEDPDEEEETPINDIENAVCPEGQVCVGDGVCSPGEDETSVDCTDENYIKNRFDQMTTVIKGTGLFTIVNNLDGLPSGGSAVMSVDLGNWGGQQTFDWSMLDYAWAILNAVFTISFIYVGIKIITLKKS